MIVACLLLLLTFALLPCIVHYVVKRFYNAEADRWEW